MRVDYTLQHPSGDLTLIEVKSAVGADYPLDGVPDERHPNGVYEVEREPFVRAAIFPHGNSWKPKIRVISERAIKQVHELTQLAGAGLAAAAKSSARDAKAADAQKGGLAFLEDTVPVHPSPSGTLVAAGDDAVAAKHRKNGKGTRKKAAAEAGQSGDAEAELFDGQKPMAERKVNAVVFFVVSRSDCAFFRPCHEACPLFASVLKRAAGAGVQMLAHDVVWYDNGKCYLGKPLDVRLDQGINEDLDEAWLEDVLDAANVFQDGRPPAGWQPKSEFLNTRAKPRKLKKRRKAAPAKSAEHSEGQDSDTEALHASKRSKTKNTAKRGASQEGTDAAGAGTPAAEAAAKVESKKGKVGSKNKQTASVAHACTAAGAGQAVEDAPAAKAARKSKARQKAMASSAAQNVTQQAAADAQDNSAHAGDVHVLQAEEAMEKQEQADIAPAGTQVGVPAAHSTSKRNKRARKRNDMATGARTADVSGQGSDTVAVDAAHVQQKGAQGHNATAALHAQTPSTAAKAGSKAAARASRTTAVNAAQLGAQSAHPAKGAKRARKGGVKELPADAENAVKTAAAANGVVIMPADTASPIEATDGVVPSQALQSTTAAGKGRKHRSKQSARA